MSGRPCDRCDTDARVHTTSMFNTQSICMHCKAAEKARPDYEQAVAADRFAVMSGNWNFEGIGLDHKIGGTP